MPQSGKAHIVVEPRPDGRWARQKNGSIQRRDSYGNDSPRRPG